MRGHAQRVALAQEQGGEVGLANPCCVVQDGEEDRLQRAGRRADDAQHVGRRGLLIERFPQFAEQSRVFDGDHGLRGEVLDEIDLLVGEWPDFMAE